MIGVNKSIFRRLLLSYMITVLLGIGVVGISMSIFVQGHIYNTTQEDLLRQAKRVNLAIQDLPVIDELTEKVIVFLDESYDTRIWIFNTNGEIIATSTKDEVSIGKSVASSIVEKVLKGENVVSKLKFEGLTEPMLSIVVPWGKENSVYGGIVLHAPVVGIKNTIYKIKETILWATLIGILISMIMVSYLSWSISRPLQKINLAASKIGLGNYNERIEINTPDEIGDLADTINTMAEKLGEIDHERQKLDKIRDDFLANVSHELKTPLTVVQGFLEALQDGLINEGGRQKYYSVMYDETIHMNRLVDDILNLIKLENKEIVISKHPISVEPLLHKVAFKFKQKVMEKNIKIDVNVKDGLPKVYADPDRLEQILNNILQNAVNFTEEGQIKIDAEKDDSFVLITIADTGVGISQEDQELIWERFFKVDRGRSKKYKGTGLGLAIVKELIELHQGKITVNSELNKGTTFKIWIPILN